MQGGKTHKVFSRERIRPAWPDSSVKGAEPGGWTRGEAVKVSGCQSPSFLDHGSLFPGSSPLPILTGCKQLAFPGGPGIGVELKPSGTGG